MQYLWKNSIVSEEVFCIYKNGVKRFTWLDICILLKWIGLRNEALKKGVLPQTVDESWFTSEVSCVKYGAVTAFDEKPNKSCVWSHVTYNECEILHDSSWTVIRVH